MTNMAIPIDAELSNYIEALHYDRQALQDLLIRAARENIRDSDAYRYWTGLYCEKCKEYGVARSELERRFIQKNVPDGEIADWSLDFESCTVQVALRGDADA